MSKSSDVKTLGIELYFLPIRARTPLKFGPETVTSVTCARVRATVEDRLGRRGVGWGETPLSVQWVWPSSVAYDERHDALVQLTIELARGWSEFAEFGDPIELGHAFQKHLMGKILAAKNREREGLEPIPRLAALVCCSPFDLAIHDAFGNLLGLPTYPTYNREYMNRDLAAYLSPAEGFEASFKGAYPCDFLDLKRPDSLIAWHLTGGKDAIEPCDLTGDEPNDGRPVLLRDWIRTDGLACVKVKLKGDDSPWDYNRLTRVGRIALEEGVSWLSADFNCTVLDPIYVIEILDRLALEEPLIYEKLLYVEQPFPYDLEAHPIDVHEVSRRKPLFLDESAHDWEMIRLGRELGWTGVALKTCKTQTGAILSQAWSKAHSMPLMVQDLSNPMLAQIPHALLAAHSGTIMGVETNGMQFYPDASIPEAAVHPGLYRRIGGRISLVTLGNTGFGQRVDEIRRELPEPTRVFGDPDATRSGFVAAEGSFTERSDDATGAVENRASRTKS
jgi:L-alanine-DL-glutamate epimerase-like enolase superfamily enzyme